MLEEGKLGAIVMLSVSQLGFVVCALLECMNVLHGVLCLSGRGGVDREGREL